MGLREEKKRATRATLSWSAIRLIVERGYDRVLVEDIATEAGVSPRTFNNYFGSKAEAVASRHLDRCRQMAAALHERPADEPLWDAITQAMLEQIVPGPEVLAHRPGDREAWAAGLGLMFQVPAIRAEFLRAGALAEESWAAAVAARTGTDVDDLYPRLVAAAVLAAQNVASQAFVHHPGKSMPDLLVESLRLIAAGLPAPRV